MCVHLLFSRDRVALDGRSAECSGFDQRNYPFRFIVQIQRDPNLNSHGLTLSAQTPILVQEVNPGTTRRRKCTRGRGTRKSKIKKKSADKKDSYCPISASLHSSACLEVAVVNAQLWSYNQGQHVQTLLCSANERLEQGTSPIVGV